VQLPASKLAPVAPLSPPPVTSAATSVPFTLSSISFDELYYLWTKAGGDAQAELVRLGCFEQLPSIESLPILVRSTNDDTGSFALIHFTCFCCHIFSFIAYNYLQQNQVRSHR
jgi:hypothetical protein